MQLVSEYKKHTSYIKIRRKKLKIKLRELIEVIEMPAILNNLAEILRRFRVDRLHLIRFSFQQEYAVPTPDGNYEFF